MDEKKRNISFWGAWKNYVSASAANIRKNKFAYRFIKIGGYSLSIVLLPLLIMYLLTIAGLFGPVPGRAELRNIRTEVASEVYSANGALMGKYFIKNRSQASLSLIPNHVIEALIATEDARFYEHGGVDIRSLIRVVFKSILLQNESSGGGSTLSQQLAKNLYPRRNFGIFSLPINKFREIIIAKRLERLYNKEEILTMYINTVSFGENVFGIESAANRFFSKSALELNIEEAATLIGMLKATTLYNPRRNRTRAEERRNLVLSQMTKYGYITRSEFDSLQKKPLVPKYTYEDHNSGLAPYFREYLRKELEDWCETHKKPNGTQYNFYTDGLKIHTTIDSRLQRYAEKAVEEEMRKLQKSFDRLRPNYQKAVNDPMIKQAMRKSHRYISLKKAGKNENDILANFREPIEMTVYSWDGPVNKQMSPLDSIIYYQYFLHAGLLAVSPRTGEVLAWVGGINHKYFKYDHVRARRQVGSTFKPILYAGALENGISPCDYISNDKMEFVEFDNWSPRNADELYGGEYSMEGGLTHSINVVAVNLMMKAGVRNVIQTAKRMGISSPLPAVPSLALGSADLSLIEMVSAYAMLTNGGKYISPHFLTKIEDREGNILYELTQSKQNLSGISAQTSEMMVHMLQSVVNSGTGAGLRSRYGIRGDIAGKTGTTQDQADGWFIGSTPHIVAGTWVGAEDRRVHFRTLQQGQGARTAMPVWASFYKKMAKDKNFRSWKNARFPSLSRESRYKLACDHYQDIMSMSEFREWWAGQQRYRSPGSFTNPNTYVSPHSYPNNTYQRSSVLPQRIQAQPFIRRRP